MSGSLVLAIDQGTSSTKALLVDSRGEIVGRAQTPVSLATPEPGWVQQDGEEIWSSVRRAASEALDADAAKRVVSVGLSTQRESCIIWDRRTGEALTPVLSWQDQRTEGTCAALRAAGHGATIRRRSGLPLDPMFSAAKAHWLLDRLPQGRARAKAGHICIGTIDAFLLSRFGGEAVVEAGNASRTQLFDVVGARWDEELLSIFDVPVNALPRVVTSRGPFPKARDLRPLRDGTPVGAVLADSHSALFAHGAFGPGPVKATQGTGSSIMGLVDRSAARDGDAGAPGVCLTLAWQLDAPMLAYEGNIRSAGSTLIWAAELLGVSTKELAELAASAPEFARRVFRASFRGPRRALVGRQRLGDSHRLFLRRHPRTLCARRARTRSLTRSPTWWTHSGRAARRSSGCWSTAARPATTSSCSSRRTWSTCPSSGLRSRNCRRWASRISPASALASSRWRASASSIAAQSDLRHAWTRRCAPMNVGDGRMRWRARVRSRSPWRRSRRHYWSKT